MIVQYVAAMNLRIGDLVIPDAGGPAQRVTLHRLQGTPPYAVVQYDGIPGKTFDYPAAMRLLVRSTQSISI